MINIEDVETKENLEQLIEFYTIAAITNIENKDCYKHMMGMIM